MKISGLLFNGARGSLGDITARSRYSLTTFRNNPNTALSNRLKRVVCPTASMCAMSRSQLILKLAATAYKNLPPSEIARYVGLAKRSPYSGWNLFCRRFYKQYVKDNPAQ